MDQALLVTVAVFVSGFIVGYLVRHIISRRRRAKLKRRRRFFYEGPLATDDSCIENLSERAKIARPIETVSKNTRKARSANRTLCQASFIPVHRSPLWTVAGDLVEKIN